MLSVENNYHGETVFVSSEQELRDALDMAKLRSDFSSTYEIVIKKWVYTLNNGFRIDTDNVLIRGETGNPDDVILQGQGMHGSVTHVFWVIGDDIRIGDMKIGNIANHAIQVMGERGADNVLVHNVKIFDTGEQMIKWSHSPDRNHMSENGVIQCSKFWYTAGIGPQYYIGGIDVHFSKNWIVRNNVFRDITSPESVLAEHAIHFWNKAEDTQVYENKIINCDRGIWFGLGSSSHKGWKIYANEIYHNANKWDVWIGLETASNIEVYDNVIFFDNTYANAIEYRFSASVNNTIHNNKTNKNIQERNEGHAHVYANETLLSNPISY